MLGALKTGGVSSPIGKISGRDVHGMVAALDRVMAVIEFSTDGNILSANGRFAAAMGFSLDEIKGHHHRMFIDPAYASCETYRCFWDDLNRGEFVADITDAWNKAMDAQGQVQAIGRSQAVIEFKLDGAIVHANGNFLGAVGYSLNEISGQHHRVFVEPTCANSTE